MPKAGKQAEKRSADQDAALETAFVEGTLPEEDRRIVDAPPTADKAATSLKRFWNPNELLGNLPPKSRVVWSNEDKPTGEWAVQPGSSRNIGRGETLRRAMQMVYAHMVPNPAVPGTFIYVDMDGNPIEEIDPSELPEPKPPEPEPPPIDGIEHPIIPLLPIIIGGGPLEPPAQ